MAQRIILYWRDIPAQVIVREGRRTEKRELSERFVQAIDQAAMLSGAKDSDSYIAGWRKGEPEACGSNLVAEADRSASDLEAAYRPERLASLAKNGGRNEG